MKSLRFYFLIATLSLGAMAAQAQSIQQDADRFLLQAPAVRQAHVGISIYDPDSAKYLFQYQSDHFFTPASNTKIPTCYLGMKYLGDSLLSFRIRESGDSLFISPAGDPTFLNPLFPHQTFFEYLRGTPKKIGVQYNAGDSFSPYGSGWTWDGFQDSYCTERASMPVFGNLVHFKREGKQGILVHPKSAARPPYFSEPLMQLLGKGDRVTIDRHFDKNQFYFRPSGSVFSSIQVPFKTDNGVTNFLFLQDTLNRHSDNFFMGFERQFNGYRNVYSQPTDSMLRVMMYDC